MFRIISLLLILVFVVPLFADDDVGLPDELFLKYGRQLTVGEPIGKAVKVLVESRFNCDDLQDKPDQILKCVYPAPEGRLVVKMTSESSKLVDFELSVEE